MWCDMGLWKKWMVYPNTCVSSSLCKVRFLTECQWPYIGASLACQWSGVGCWRDGTRMWCELLWRLPPPMLCDHWCCLVCPDIASWSLGTGSPPHKTWVWPNISAVLWWITNSRAKLLCQMKLVPGFHTASQSLHKSNIMWEIPQDSTLKEGN